MTTIFDHLAYKLDEEVAAKEKQVSSGMCSSFDEYRHLTGVIKGLKLSRDIIQEAYDNLDKMQDE